MIIHLGWVGSAVPDHVHAAAEAARRISPASEVMLHAGERDVPTRWRETMDGLDLRPHMRSDVQRHAVLQRYGGLWLDADVRLVRDPAAWTAGWDRYTAIYLRESPSLIGTDIIYAPAGWDGWRLIDAEIDRVLAKTAFERRVGVLALAHRMIDNCQRRRREAFQILEPGTLFPFGADAFTTDSVVARGFDPPSEPQAAMPSLVKRAATFTAAAARHVAAGMPRASDEEVERRFAICHGCEHFDGSACRKCGCGISRERRFLSKLAWAGEKCPVGKWGPVSALTDMPSVAGSDSGG